VTGIEAYNPLNSWLNIGGKIQGLWPNVGGVTDSNVISIDTQHTEQTAPGLTRQPPMTHEQIYLHPKAQPFRRLELDYFIGYDFCQDTSNGHFSFRRFETIAEHTFFPVTNKRGDPERDRAFIFRWRLSAADSSAGTPCRFTSRRH
jgi:hypothetical protein